MRSIQETIQYIWRKADIALLALIVAASCYGLVLVTSASQYTGDNRNTIVQAAAIVLGICGYFFFSVADVEHFSEKWQWFFVFNVGFILLLLTPLGVEENGNRSWLYTQGMPTSIQPAEIVKLTFTILLAKQIAWFRENRKMRGLDSLLWPAAHAGFMFALIFVVSSDVGSGLVYLVIYVGMAFAAGLPWYWFVAGFGAAAVGGTALVVLDKIPSYMLERFRVIFDHSYMPDDVGWQQTRGLMALGSGGVFGQGLFNGIQTQSLNEAAIPERETDFIFCVAGEELGMVGCLLIILLEALIIYRCFHTARMARSSMESLVCVGFATMLMFQVVENIGMCLFIMPVIGLTLPFFSYGGSSMVTLFCAMGIVSGIRKRALPEWLRN